jgi:hypothetical protein
MGSPNDASALGVSPSGSGSVHTGSSSQSLLALSGVDPPVAVAVSFVSPDSDSSVSGWFALGEANLKMLGPPGVSPNGDFNPYEPATVRRLGLVAVRGAAGAAGCCGGCRYFSIG